MIYYGKMCHIKGKIERGIFMEQEFYYNSSKVSTIIKDLALLFLVLGIIIGLVFCTLGENIVLGVALIIGLSIFALLLYALGEIISLLHDIRENTEHLRDNIKGEETWKKAEEKAKV